MGYIIGQHQQSDTHASRSSRPFLPTTEFIGQFADAQCRIRSLSRSRASGQIAGKATIYVHALSRRTVEPQVDYSMMSSDERRLGCSAANCALESVSIKPRILQNSIGLSRRFCKRKQRAVRTLTYSRGGTSEEYDLEAVSFDILPLCVVTDLVARICYYRGFLLCFGAGRANEDSGEIDAPSFFLRSMVVARSDDAWKRKARTFPRFGQAALKHRMNGRPYRSIIV